MLWLNIRALKLGYLERDVWKYYSRIENVLAIDPKQIQSFITLPADKQTFDHGFQLVLLLITTFLSISKSPGGETMLDHFLHNFQALSDTTEVTNRVCSLLEILNCFSVHHSDLNCTVIYRVGR